MRIATISVSSSESRKAHSNKTRQKGPWLSREKGAVDRYALRMRKGRDLENRSQLSGGSEPYGAAQIDQVSAKIDIVGCAAETAWRSVEKTLKRMSLFVS